MRLLVIALVVMVAIVYWLFERVLWRAWQERRESRCVECGRLVTWGSTDPYLRPVWCAYREGPICWNCIPAYVRLLGEDWVTLYLLRGPGALPREVVLPRPDGGQMLVHLPPGGEWDSSPNGPA